MTMMISTSLYGMTVQFAIYFNYFNNFNVQVIEKQSIGGVPLGEDVLELIVELKVDQALIMALITVYGLINNTL